MIKAKKGLLIALFAAMMVFAFGATSAFAANGEYIADGVKWTDNFTKVEIGGTTYDTTLSVSSDGLIHATKTIIDVDQDYTFDAYFYDLDGAKLYDINEAAVDATRTYASYAAWLGNYDGNGMPLLVKPEKPAYFTGTWNVTQAVWPENYDVTVATPTVEEAVAGDKITIETDIEAENDANGTESRPYLLGSNPTGVVTLSTGSTDFETSGWFIDEAKAGNEYSTDSSTASGNAARYDGFDHTLVYGVVASSEFGPTVAVTAKVTGYEKRNKRTGEWEGISTITYKHAVDEDDADQYRAIIETTQKSAEGTWTYTTRTAPIPLIVYPTYAQPTIAWAESNNWGPTKIYDGDTYYQLTAEQAANPEAFLEFANGFVAKAAPWSEDIEGNVEADLVEMKAMFNELYDIDVTKNAANEKLLTWQVNEKPLSWKEMQEIFKKHETLLNDYYDQPDVPEAAIHVAVVEQVEPVQADIVDFTFAPTTKTYHVKKAKKLKKAKSFTVEASAKSGKAVTYILKTPNKKITIDSATGMVTVKKGIKKGTYKIKVTARTEAGNGYAAAQDVANITIKVKK